MVESHYRGGTGAPIYADASEIDGLLNKSFVSWTQNPRNPNEYVVGTFGRDGFGADSQGRALGQITAVLQTDGSYTFKTDYYNFNQHANPSNNVAVGLRNFFTDLGSRVAGPGRPFDIHIGGTWRPTYPDMPVAP